MSRTKELEAKLQETEKQLRLFQRISRMMAREVSLQEVLRNTVSLVSEHMRCDSCLLYLLDGDEMVLCAVNTPHLGTVGAVRLKLDEGLTGWVARERRLLAISRKAYDDARFKLFRDLPEDTFEAFLSVPVIARNRVLGVMNVQHRDQHSHTGDEMELLTTIGELVGSLLVLTRVDLATIEQGDHAQVVLAAATPAGESE